MVLVLLYREWFFMLLFLVLWYCCHYIRGWILLDVWSLDSYLANHVTLEHLYLYILFYSFFSPFNTFPNITYTLVFLFLTFYHLPNNTYLQAIRKHKFVNILDDPGSADLSAYVDFASIRHCAEEASGACPHCASCIFFLPSLNVEVKEKMKINLNISTFYRRCVCPWPNYSVSVSWFSWDKFPSGRSSSELHRRTSWVPQNGILASGRRRWSPLLGGTWWTGAYWNGYPVFGNGYCEQEAGCSSSISVRSGITWHLLSFMYIINLCLHWTNFLQFHLLVVRWDLIL